MEDGIIFDRPFSGPDDLRMMIDLVKERPSDRITDFPGILDLQEMLAVPRIQASTHLWNDPLGQLVGFAILDGDQDSASLIFEFNPGRRGASLEMKIFNWAEAYLRNSTSSISDPFSLEASASSDNLERIAHLEKYGFDRQAGGAFHLERSLADPIPPPQLPAGFVIRPIRGEVEAEDWIRLHRIALGTESLTTEYKLAMMRTPYYNPEMDLLAVAPDGSLAAYCVCFINVEENTLTGQRNGYTDPIATHPDFRRQGLARGLMLTGMALLKDHGMDKACLGTDSQNTAMLHAAGSVGFRITRKVIRYGKFIHSRKEEGGK
jgi:mycothiol synthase